METTFKFTLASTKDLKCLKGKQQTLYWDSGIRGLGLRISQTGKKSFFFEKRLHGKTIRFPIGDIPFDKVQELAYDLQHKFALGIDPRQEREEKGLAQAKAKEQKKAQADREKVLVKDAWDDYIEYQKSLMKLKDLAKGKKWGERHLQDHMNLTQQGGIPHKKGDKFTVQGVLYPLLELRLAQVTSEVLKDWLNQERITRPNNARQGFQMFRTFWNWCAKQQDYKPIINFSAIADDSLLAIIPSKNSKKDGDVLRKNNIADWFGAVQKLSNKVISAYLQCLLITGARRGELIALKWADVDFKAKTVWLKDKIKTEGRYIPLNLYMEQLIDSLPRRNEYVFSSLESKEGFITEPRIAHNQAIALAGIPHLSIHGLRRSFASLFIWAEQPDGAGARIQGHAPQSIRDKHYLDIPIELLAKWHDGYVNWLLTEAGIPFLVEERKRLQIIS
jgi:integrase